MSNRHFYSAFMFVYACLSVITIFKAASTYFLCCLCINYSLLNEKTNSFTLPVSSLAWCMTMQRFRKNPIHLNIFHEIENTDLLWEICLFRHAQEENIELAWGCRQTAQMYCREETGSLLDKMQNTMHMKISLPCICGSRSLA